MPVSFEVGVDINDNIITDEEWLWQMLLNLLTNACKYTARGSIHVRVSLVAGTSSDRANNVNNSGVNHYNNYSSIKINSVMPYMTVCTTSLNIMFEVIDTGTDPDFTA